MTSFTYGSLFARIGGLDLGLERAGMQCQWQVEIHRYANRVLQKRWPHVTRFHDVRECGKRNLHPVQLIAGGFPCTDISPAGKRAGITGTHSRLWNDFARIVGELRPSFVLVENSADLLKRGMGTVLADLAGMGYDAEWRVLSAAQFGAPHLRKRVFIVAYTHRYAHHLTTKPPLHFESGQQTSPQRLCSEMADSDRYGRETLYAQPGLLQTAQSGGILQSPDRSRFVFEQPVTRWDIWANEPDVGRVADGVSCRVDRLRGLGNAVVPQVAEYIGRCILSAFGGAV
jgi:DNA (cytosine-5)-methyltransferase 1